MTELRAPEIVSLLREATRPKVCLTRTMAGIRHHTIQKLLLRGFTSRSAGKTEFAWHFRAGVKPLEVSLRDLTVVKHFYGRAGELNADGNITEFESKEITPLVQSLRALAHSQEVKDERIAPFAAHWMVRTTALRHKFVASSDHLVDEIANQIATPEGLDRMLPGLGALATELGPVFQKYFADIKHASPAAAQQAHVKALSANVSPPVRVDALRPLSWTLHILPERELIVGDVGPLAQIAGEEVLKPLVDKGEVADSVYVPISADRLLYGRVMSAAPWGGDVDALNLEFARQSQEEFIASSCTARELSYQAVLGSHRHLIPTRTLEDIAQTAIEEVFGADEKQQS